MPDQVIAEFLKQGLLGAVLIVAVWHFLREVKTARAERDACHAELRKLEEAMRDSVIPAVVRMIDATATTTHLVTEVRAELQAERGRRAP